MTEQMVVLPTRPTARQLALQVGTATLGRFWLNTARRFVYPFAPALSRGLGVPLTSVTSLIAINNATGLLSPLFGPLGDRWGYRVLMLLGLSILAIGMLAAGLLPFYGVILVALFLAGLGKGIYDPALQAYVGERVPYHRRGLAIGVVEFAWAGSSLIGIPVAGLLIESWGWSAPFLAIGGLSLVTVGALGRLIPSDRSTRRGKRLGPHFGAAWGQLYQEPAAWGVLTFAFFGSMANDNLFVVLGLWFERSFGLSLTALGLAASVIGLAELIGEALTASISDRLGLKRAIFAGSIMACLSYLLLSLIGQTLPLALLALFILFLVFEFTIVTALSLATEVLPDARATMMSSLQAAASLGRVSGAILGGLVWFAGGLAGVSLASAVITGLGMAGLWWGLRRWRL